MVKKLLLVIGISVWCATHSPTLVNAAIKGFSVNPKPDAEILLTWKANNYTPPTYKGKAIPSGRTAIIASMQLIDNGEIVDVSDRKIIWYVNNEFYESGLGLQTIQTGTPKFPGEIVFIRAEIQNYKNQNLLKTVEIKTVRPEIIIETSYPNNTTFERVLTAYANPYFFNVKNAKDLVYKWTVNEQEAQSTENPQVLTIGLSEEAKNDLRLDIVLSATNPNDKTVFSKITNQSTILFSPSNQ
jgi:hypothetical protein